MKVYQRPLFLRRFKKLTTLEQAAVRAEALRLPDVFGKPHLHAGLGLRSFGRFFEFRVGLDLRVLFLVDAGDAHLVTVGNHDDIRAYVRNNS